MSALPEVRRADKLMPDEETLAFLAEGYCGRLGTVGAEGQPYVTPLLYVVMDGEIWVHNAITAGHLRANVLAEPRVCFEVDDAGPVFAYGRFECDTTVAYRSAVAFGRVRIVADRAAKERFCHQLMAKYGPPDTGRPEGFYPRLAAICVYAITVERLTGKRTPLPSLSDQFPAKDRSASPDAQAPGLPQR